MPAHDPTDYLSIPQLYSNLQVFCSCCPSTVTGRGQLSSAGQAARRFLLEGIDGEFHVECRF